MIEEIFVCYDETKLQAYSFEIAKPKGVVQFIHGIQEYSKPYFWFAEFLNKKGFNVYMVDQRAHGKSCKKISEIGKADGDIFSASVCDQLCITNMLHAKYDLPVYVIGFSYGSFILQQYLQKTKYAEKAILIGSGFMNTPKIHLAKVICKIEKKLKGKDSYAKNLEKIIQKYFNRKNKNNGTWITSDEEQAKVLSSDKLCRIPFSYGFYDSLLSNLPKITKRVDKVNSHIEILMLSGTKDPVGDYAKGVERLYNLYKKNNLNAKLILYSKARHNLLYEKNKNEVLTDIINFLAKK